ncbi:RNA pseudouridine synthase [Fructilactobacillus lindneri]|uniref:Pseudouridine synthase n=2 Tax=Fructilactobacillus lindneri TaxID=53444 RepID=A0A0R2K1W4_9LACO|nr:RluA family pseudouridine synthase [Fructilactobacillus lindneri]ANZ57486.1 RNA pseudouridine synthase [Fructilactobacillus lindneri]ANZ58754.1 RNA pseudouridine synthase [Fructilactobacillus lindneri]KRN80471.1 hypothetical protein IV52_GL000045 [Fructilactobacillus lindneri DSM 20690 = JCM 11027]POG97816.1 RNA pseudouridine synthase [Fructilactobacillus lindneri]POG99149.1 RNA pseudouridine synthase [Fructilactobacillus lindneri]
MQTWRYNLIIPNSYEGKTVRDYLSQHLYLPKHLIFSLRRAQRVTVNKKYLPMNFKLHTGDQLHLEFRTSDFKNAHPKVIRDASSSVQVLFENQDFLLVNKRRGYKTHPNQPQEQGAVINFVAEYLKPNSPFIIHRLDQQTSGALLFAKSPAVVPALEYMLREKIIQRTYLVWVRGRFLHEKGTITIPIGRDPNDQRKRMINGIDSQPAVTHYQVQQSKNDHSLLKVNLETGRTHQIRVHLASLGHPVVNDPLYDPQANLNQLMLLHSWKVKMPTPFYYESITVTAPLPPEMKAIK